MQIQGNAQKNLGEVYWKMTSEVLAEFKLRVPETWLDKVQDIPVYISNNATSEAGCAHLGNESKIILHRYLIGRDKKLIDTFLHELAHQIALHKFMTTEAHGKAWSYAHEELKKLNKEVCSPKADQFHDFDVNEMDKSAKQITNYITCPTCGKPAVELSSDRVASTIIVHLRCGHIILQEATEIKDESFYKSLKSHSGNELYPFQVEGCKFGENANLRFLCCDEMGLGKTVQALSLLRNHAEALPALIICKSGLKYQWMHQIYEWCFPELLDQEDFIDPVIMVNNEHGFIPGKKVYIISMDLLSHINAGLQNGTKKAFHWKAKAEKITDLASLLLKCKVKTIIIDECQHIKNSNAKRTKGVKELSRLVPNFIALSGTPIKNNALEYFPVLNMLKPELFHSEMDFVRNWVAQVWRGNSMKLGPLKNPERFHNLTKNFIIRRERAEVLPNLPKIRRTYSYFDLGPEVEEAYKNTMASFTEYFENEEERKGAGAFKDSSNILAFLSKMRHLVGISLVDNCIDYLMEFLGSCERKIVVFVHHKDVAEMLNNKLLPMLQELELDFELLNLTSDLDALQRDELITKFKDSPSRIMIASTLASGEGLNLQFCSDCVMLERQWNPANEEQAEGRFPRPGSTAESINCWYPTAMGTVNEYFAEIVESKRRIVKATLRNEEMERWEESDILKELTQALASKGKARWRL